MKHFLSQRLSLNTRGARYQIGVAMALITVIPTLVVAYLAFTQSVRVEDLLLHQPIIPMLLLVVVVSGYMMMNRYPSNILRLRTYLEDMVDGRMPEKVTLLKGMADIPAIERSMNLIVEQLNRQVSQMEGELKRIEWLVSRNVTPAFWKTRRENRKEMALRETHRHSGETLILDSVGGEMLVDIVGDILDLAESAAVVFEQNGEVALDLIVSDWCRFLDETSQQTGAAASSGTGSGACGGGCGCDPAWKAAALECMQSGQPVDIECPGGIRIYCVPILAAHKAAGAAGFAYDDPPRDPEKLRIIAERYGVAVDVLAQKAKTYESRPSFVVSVAKNRLMTLSKLMGEIVERKQAERVLLRGEEELLRHRHHLEDLVEERTSEMKAANMRLEREVQERRKAEKLKDEFVSTVSHELRTPLAITKEGIALLLDSIPGPINEKQARVLEAAAGNVDRLTLIINDLLDIAKIEAGKLDLRKERLDLGHLIRQAAAAIEPLAKQKGLAVAAEAGAGVLDVYADGDRIMQVLMNLVGNAVKFTHQGRISISAARHDGEVECAVSDTGIGIAEADMPRLFTKFVQIGRKHGAGQKGTGLGLAIAKNIVELHQGRIWVESALQQGTCFRFSLPAFSENEALNGEVERRLGAARFAGDSFVLLIARLEIDLTQPGAEGKVVEIRKALADLVELRVFARDSDFALVRGDREVIVLADMPFDQISSVCRRWRETIPGRLSAATGLQVAGLVCGYARYPIDGVTGSALVKKAESSLAAENATQPVDG